MAKYEDLEKIHENVLVLQLIGKFYNAFGDSARVLSVLMDYKLNEKAGTLKAGFPIESLSKVIDALDAFHVNYVIYRSGLIEYEKLFEDNAYRTYLGQCPSIEQSVVKIAEQRMLDVSDTNDLSIDCSDMSGVSVYSFIRHICEGKDPYSGEVIDSLNLNDVKVVRMLFKVKEKLSERM